jgi:hypothetical protein
MHMSVLSGGRVQISFTSNMLAINALAIGLRYSLCRKQFFAPKATT